MKHAYKTTQKQKPENSASQETNILSYVVIIPIIYIIAVSIYMISHRAWFSPDQFFAVAMVIVIIVGRGKQFIVDWTPLILLLFGYEYLRGLGPIFSQNIHIHSLINADKFLFSGTIPTIWLQKNLFNPETAQWYDYMAVILYIIHFIVPMFAAFYLWLRNRSYFRQYAAGFLILSYMAFFTYLFYPAMPPWMASEKGYIPPLVKIMDRVMASFAHPIDVPSVYRFFGANLVAPMPSIHAAYPFLIFLFFTAFYSWRGLFILPYVFGVWFSIVYLGEHYVIDAIAGAMYAGLAFTVVRKLSQGATLSELSRKIAKFKDTILFRFSQRKKR